eukprot:762426-Hanusia_phi.AAC.4
MTVDEKEGMQNNMSKAVEAMNLGRKRGEEEAGDGESPELLVNAVNSLRWLTRDKRRAKEMVATALEKKKFSDTEALMQKVRGQRCGQAR